MHLLSDEDGFAPKTHRDTINSRSIAQVSTVVFMEEKESQCTNYHPDAFCTNYFYNLVDRKLTTKQTLNNSKPGK